MTSVTRTILRLVLAVCAVASTAAAAGAQAPRPQDVFGFTPGDDYKLADYSQLLQYYRELDRASDRLQLVEIGTTTQGRPMVLAFISSERNLQQLDKWRGISAQLAKARGLSDEQARRLAREGRAIVWIDNGLHSTEVASAQHAPLLAHHLVTDESEETRRIRDNVVLLLMPMMNPDGHEIVVNWYRRHVGTPFETTGPPVLYNQYVGHDNNRDWYMLLQKETQNLAQVVYHQWYPQIMLNHHQTGPFPSRVHIAPFDEPLNPNIHPLAVRSVSLVGTYMGQRYEQEGKSGVISQRVYDMWRADGTRYAPYYRNMVGVHTEVSHNSATPRFHHPDSLPAAFSGRTGTSFLSAREPSVFYPNPWRGGWARLRMAVDYTFTASMGVLDLASHLREQWLYNIYAMGRDAIRAGEAGTPYAFVVSPEQHDPGEAVEMVNALLRGGAEVHRATAGFSAGGRSYPAGTYVIRAAQAFRPLLRVLLEPQVYPEVRLYPGGPVAPPRDLAGWTMPIQMGVGVDRIDQPFQARLQEITQATVEAAKVVGSATYGYALRRNRNASALAINRLLAAGEEVSWTGAVFSAGGKDFEAGTIIVRNRAAETGPRVEAVASQLGIEVSGLDAAPVGTLHRLSLPRVAVYKSRVANMDEGWTRWLLERYEFALDTLVDAQVRAGSLDRYNVIVLPDQGTTAMLNGHTPGTMPPEYVGGLGAEGAAALKRFVERGGTVVALDGASDFAIEQFGLPVRNIVAGLPEDRFSIPGTLLRLDVDGSSPLANGMSKAAAAFFIDSRAFEAVNAAREGERSAGPQPVEVVARYADRDILLSGLAVGSRYIAGKPAVVRVGLGQGSVVLIGFRAQFRGQPRSTFKLLFNAIHSATAEGLPRPGTLAADGGGSH